eukprot:TRINITY_DN10679_c0_g1_i2.p1 TRINITY_DN10679_c0_g1~~TRINITY_DN10679_c0_g1_i2.p1  ORF type:complete len:360 (+),score=106.66 TRINITY_DN10679_c0_g1_i2:74-1153(+)
MAAQQDLGVCAVIGGAGWLGSHLVRQLAADGGVTKPVRSFDIQAERADCPARELAVHTGGFDMRDAQRVSSALEGVDTVFLVAAVIDIRLFPAPVCRAVNVGGTENVVRACRERGVRRLIYTSSLDVVGGGLSKAHEGLPYCGKTICFSPLYIAPANGYYRTKAEAERLALGADSGDLSVVALRMAHIYGTEDDVYNMVANTPVATGPSSAQASFVYVENGAAAHIQAARGLAAEPAALSGKAFFISDFDGNLTDTYRSFGGLGPARIRVPYWLIVIVFTLMEMVAAAVYLVLCGTRLPYVRDGKLSVGLSALDCAREHTVDSTAARRAFYKPPVSDAEARRRTRDWIARSEKGRSKED